jgi:hypothetical protein
LAPVPMATARLLGQSTLATELGVEGADEDDLYAALDWLGSGERQERILGASGQAASGRRRVGLLLYLSFRTSRALFLPPPFGLFGGSDCERFEFAREGV